jgi:ribonuclease Z
MKVVFLGTSGSMPTPERGSSSVALVRGREVILLDCGEGTQRQMVAAHIGFTRPTRILVSHLHGDHVLGIPGLLQSMTLQRREAPLEVYGPVGTTAYIQAFTSTLGGPGFPVTIYEIQKPGIVHDSAEYRIEATEADHEVKAWSYALVEYPRPGRFHPDRARSLGVPEGVLWKRLQGGEDVELSGRVVRSSEVVDPPRPGRKVVYSGDTRPTDGLVRLAEGADLLIHEATFGEELAERAAEDGHSTARQAAEVAAKAGVERLILTHISSRYPDEVLLEAEARAVFQNTVAARDLMAVEVPLRES